jgi:hypothetical protein
MGWWSHDILGGDTPLDFKDEIFGICGVEEFPESGKRNELTSEDISSKLGDIISMIENTRFGETYIGYQVLSVLMMKTGTAIPESLFPMLEDACFMDEWAKESDERKESVYGLLAALRAYDNQTPITVRSRGLFEVMAEKLGNTNN